MNEHTRCTPGKGHSMRYGDATCECGEIQTWSNPVKLLKADDVRASWRPSDKTIHIGEHVLDVEHARRIATDIFLLIQQLEPAADGAGSAPQVVFGTRTVQGSAPAAPSGAPDWLAKSPPPSGAGSAPPPQLQIAERIARLAHAGQQEHSTGDDYILHVERVVSLVDGETAKAVAWLHDVLEDTDVSEGELGRAGVSAPIIDAVRLLTHGIGHDARNYSEYIHDIKESGNALALDVKLADLRDHLRPNCPDRLRRRYVAALEKLETAARGRRVQDQEGST